MDKNLTKIIVFLIPLLLITWVVTIWLLDKKPTLALPRKTLDRWSDLFMLLSLGLSCVFLVCLIKLLTTIEFDLF